MLVSIFKCITEIQNFIKRRQMKNWMTFRFIILYYTNKMIKSTFEVVLFYVIWMDMEFYRFHNSFFFFLLYSVNVILFFVEIDCVVFWTIANDFSLLIFLNCWCVFSLSWITNRQKQWFSEISPLIYQMIWRMIVFRFIKSLYTYLTEPNLKIWLIQFSDICLRINIIIFTIYFNSFFLSESHITKSMFSKFDHIYVF